MKDGHFKLHRRYHRCVDLRSVQLIMLVQISRHRRQSIPEYSHKISHSTMASLDCYWWRDEIAIVIWQERPSHIPLIWHLILCEMASDNYQKSIWFLRTVQVPSVRRKTVFIEKRKNEKCIDMVVCGISFRFFWAIGRQKRFRCRIEIRRQLNFTFLGVFSLYKKWPNTQHIRKISTPKPHENRWKTKNKTRWLFPIAFRLMVFFFLPTSRMEKEIKPNLSESYFGVILWDLI